jgi:glycine dehydrogenase
VLGREDNPLNHAPHTLEVTLTADGVVARLFARAGGLSRWPWVRERKFWPAVGRVESAFGDRNLAFGSRRRVG